MERIRSLRPRRILEIGVGSGLLLSKLAPDAEAYWATDFAAPVIRKIGRGAAPGPGAGRQGHAPRPARRRPDRAARRRLLRHHRHQLRHPVLPEHRLPDLGDPGRDGACSPPAARCSSATSATCGSPAPSRREIQAGEGRHGRRAGPGRRTRPAPGEGTPRRPRLLHHPRLRRRPAHQAGPPPQRAHPLPLRRRPVRRRARPAVDGRPAVPYVDRATPPPTSATWPTCWPTAPVRLTGIPDARIGAAGGVDPETLRDLAAGLGHRVLTTWSGQPGTYDAVFVTGEVPRADRRALPPRRRSGPVRQLTRQPPATPTA